MFVFIFVCRGLDLRFYALGKGCREYVVVTVVRGSNGADLSAVLAKVTNSASPPRRPPYDACPARHCSQFYCLGNELMVSTSVYANVVSSLRQCSEQFMPM